MTYPIEVIRSVWNRICPPEPFPSLESQIAYWRAKEKEQDDLAADTRMERLSEQDYE